MLHRGDLYKLMQAVAWTGEGEIWCDECFEHMDRLAEMEISGSDAATAMPLVHDHLRRCEDCLQTYEALLVAVSAG